jgi:hypothetical protein
LPVAPGTSLRERLLPGARVVPCMVEVHAVLVESEALAQLNGVTGSVGGLDLGELNRFRQRVRSVRLADLEHVMLSGPQTVLRLRLDEPEVPETRGEAEVDLTALQGGIAHAVVLWHTLVLSPGCEVSTAPDSSDLSARQVAYYLQSGGGKPCRVSEGQELRLSLSWSPRQMELRLRARGGDCRVGGTALEVEEEVQPKEVQPKEVQPKEVQPKEVQPKEVQPALPAVPGVDREQARYSRVLATSLPTATHVGTQNAGSRGGTLFDYHFPMINDAGRTNTFNAAITAAVVRHQPSLVLDIGSGSGLLALLAARA